MDWFKHKTGSHENPDISDAMDEFGDSGYSVYFILMELYGKEFNRLIDRKLVLSKTFVQRRLRKSWTKVEQILNFYSDRQKILYHFDGKFLTIEVPKFLEIASNWVGREQNKKKQQPTEEPTEEPTAIEEEEEIEEEIEEDKQYTNDVKNPDCPHQDIINLYHLTLPELQKVKIWGEDSRKKLKTRWKEDSERQSLDWWKSFFLEKIKTSDYLMGKVNNFQVNLGWMIGPKNFEKIMNGMYVNNKFKTTQFSSGPRYKTNPDILNLHDAEAYLKKQGKSAFEKYCTDFKISNKDRDIILKKNQETVL